MVTGIIITGLLTGIVLGGTGAITTHGEWTWISGSDIADQAGTYGTKGTPAADNIPGSRQASKFLVDANGDFWLFGGWGYDSTGTYCALNDLWHYDTTSGEWTWVSGSDTGNKAGTYGIKGTPAASNILGSRVQSSSWVDANGDFWLFGGWNHAYFPGDSVVWEGLHNDLWRYDISTGEWTWMSGSDITDQSGTYGTKGTPSTDNIPGARWESYSWVDSNGDFWLFGGYGYDSAGTINYLNDLWRYDTTTGEWTWVTGSDTGNQVGTYGTKRTPAASNIPGARRAGVSWVDADGDFWLFGGDGWDSGWSYDQLNDLWRYDISTGEWTWMSGSDTSSQVGTYGIKGTPAAANIPGARYASPNSWVDLNGDFWLFGGYGYDSAGSELEINDLWRYNTTTGEWTWVAGSDTGNQEGTYGIKGISAAINIPGARCAGVSWIDTDGDFWLFGGLREVNPGSFSLYNDLWRYDAVTPSVSTTTTTTTTAISPGWTFAVFSVTFISVTVVKRLYRKDD